MDTAAVLAAYDEQLRRHAGGSSPYHVDRDDHVVRVEGDGWAGVTWSALDESNADAVIAREVARMAGREWEWKHHSYDTPADLPERLLAAGFRREPPETLLVAEVAALALEPRPPEGVELVDVTDEHGVARLVAVHDEVFGRDHTALGREVLAGLARTPPSVAAVLAVAGDRPVSGGRVEFADGTDFASLWGGGTVPEWRGRGIFRALVAHRAALAAARGFRWLQVDATDDSRPILERLGFVPLAVTTPFTHPGTA